MRYRYKLKFKLKGSPDREVSGCWDCEDPITDPKNFDLLHEISKNLSEDLQAVILPEHIEILESILEHDRGEKKKNPGELSNYSIKPLP